MPDTLYDTRFFLATYGNQTSLETKVRSEVQSRKRKYVSAITIHEVYRISLEDEGREVAKIRTSSIERDFDIINIDSEIASESAEIKVGQGRDFPIADALIVATAKLRRLVCFTDDEHIRTVDGLRTRWF